MDSGESQSVYTLDTSKATPVPKAGQPDRIDLRWGDLGAARRTGQRHLRRQDSWKRIQISQTPGKRRAGRRRAGPARAAGFAVHLFAPGLGGVRRDVGGTLVEVAALERSGGGDIRSVLDELVEELRAKKPEEEEKMTDAAWGNPATRPSRPPGWCTSWPCWRTWWSGRRWWVARLGVRPGSRCSGRQRAERDAARRRAMLEVREHRVALFGRLGCC